MKLLILNSSNYVSQNKYEINLPSTYKANDGDKIGVANISIYNSTFNITSARGNNTIQLTWSNGTVYTFTFPDGYYSASDMNYFLQQQMILNNLYLYSTSSTSTYTYYAEITTNAPKYAIQLNLYPIPTSAQATSYGLAQPSGAGWSYPVSATTPQLTITSSFGLLIGQSAGTYPNATQSTTYSTTSSFTPTISPVDTYVLCCNMIDNKYSVPNNILYSVPITSSLGTMMTSQNSQIIFSDIAPNIYNKITITFFDQLFNTLLLQDKEICLTLAIKSANEL